MTAFDSKINGGPPEGSEKDQIQERDEEEVEEGKEGKEGMASVIEKEDGRRASVISPTEIPPPAAANAHVEPTLIEELEAKHEAMLQKQEGEEELSQIEGAENDMLLVFIGLVRGTYSHYRGRRGMSLEDAMQHYIDEKEPCQKDFMSRVSGRGMHESVVAMYSEKYETTFEENRARMVKDLTLLIAKDADDLERAQAELMRRDFENVSTKICPSFVVGNHESPSRWTCVELGCGTGSSGVYMAQQGCRVVGIDLIPHPLREASAKAVMSGVAKSCVWVNGNVFDLQGRALTFEGALKVLDRHIVGEGDWGVKGVVPLGVVLEESGAGVENGGDFDFVFDCQCFHVLREVQSETKAVNAIRSVLRPGGLLMVLTGNDNEPECGPAVLSLAQLKRPFSAAFDLGTMRGKATSTSPHSALIFLIILPTPSTVADMLCVPRIAAEAVIETRFDRTHEYDKLEKSPLAWCGLFRKRVSPCSCAPTTKILATWCRSCNISLDHATTVYCMRCDSS